MSPSLFLFSQTVSLTCLWDLNTCLCQLLQCRPETDFLARLTVFMIYSRKLIQSLWRQCEITLNWYFISTSKWHYIMPQNCWKLKIKIKLNSYLLSIDLISKWGTICSKFFSVCRTFWWDLKFHYTNFFDALKKIVSGSLQRPDDKNILHIGCFS